MPPKSKSLRDISGPGQKYNQWSFYLPAVAKITGFDRKEKAQGLIRMKKQLLNRDSWGKALNTEPVICSLVHWESEKFGPIHAAIHTWQAGL